MTWRPVVVSTRQSVDSALKDFSEQIVDCVNRFRDQNKSVSDMNLVCALLALTAKAARNVSHGALDSAQKQSGLPVQEFAEATLQAFYSGAAFEHWFVNARHFGAMAEIMYSQTQGVP